MARLEVLTDWLARNGRGVMFVVSLLTLLLLVFARLVGGPWFFTVLLAMLIFGVPLGVRREHLLRPDPSRSTANSRERTVVALLVTIGGAGWLALAAGLLLAWFAR